MLIKGIITDFVSRISFPLSTLFFLKKAMEKTVLSRGVNEKETKECSERNFRLFRKQPLIIFIFKMVVAKKKQTRNNLNLNETMNQTKKEEEQTQKSTIWITKWRFRDNNFPRLA